MKQLRSLNKQSLSQRDRNIISFSEKSGRPEGAVHKKIKMKERGKRNNPLSAKGIIGNVT